MYFNIKPLYVRMSKYHVNVKIHSTTQSDVLHQARGKKRQIGWFPANYVKLLSPSTSKTTPTEPLPPKLAPSHSGNQHRTALHTQTPAL